MRGHSLHHPETSPARLLGGAVLASLAGVAGLEAWLDGRAADDASRSVVAEAATSEGMPYPRTSCGRPSHGFHVSFAAPLQTIDAGAMTVPLAAEAQCAPTRDDPGRIAELEAELAALRRANEELKAQIARCEELRDDWERIGLGNLFEVEMRRALRRDFADVVTGSIKAGGRAWSLENELVGILLREAYTLRPRMIGDVAGGLAVPNLDTFDWPTFRATIGDGRIRCVGQALPALLRERGLAPEVAHSSCFTSHSPLRFILRRNGLVGGQVVTVESITVPDGDPRMAEVHGEEARFEVRYHAAIEALLGLQIYGDDMLPPGNGCPPDNPRG